MKLDRSQFYHAWRCAWRRGDSGAAEPVTATGSAVHVPTYVIALAGKYLCFAMLALAVDLVWGFAGILSLGPCRILRAWAATPWACT